MPTSFLRIIGLVAVFAIASTLAGCISGKPQPSSSPSFALKMADSLAGHPFSGLPGWESDDLRAAWPAYLASCKALSRKADWRQPCRDASAVEAGDSDAIRHYFETHFTPHRIVNPDGSDTGLATGYYEPLLNGARRRGGRFQTPLHGAPDDLVVADLSAEYPALKGGRPRAMRKGSRLVPYLTRAEISRSGRMAGKVLLWVDDPVDAFFLQVQGSGRVRLADTGEIVRVSYADTNGHPYRSIGRYLVERNELLLEQASAQGIKSWLAANPSRLQEVLNANPAYIFFREERLPDPQQGPKGALGVPLTPQRSIAIDPQFVPLGAPVFLSTSQPNSDRPLNALVLAQDTGSAIKGAVRADYFWGFGADAGELAGRMKQRASMWVLLPNTTGARKR